MDGADIAVNAGMHAGTGRHGIHLDPNADKTFFADDYPDDLSPIGKLMDDFDHPYPAVQESDAFDKDFVQDENSDNGEWSAQENYDRLRIAFPKYQTNAAKALARKLEIERTLNASRAEEAALDEQLKKLLRKQGNQSESGSTTSSTTSNTTSNEDDMGKANKGFQWPSIYWPPIHWGSGWGKGTPSTPFPKETSRDRRTEGNMTSKTYDNITRIAVVTTTDSPAYRPEDSEFHPNSRVADAAAKMEKAVRNLKDCQKQLTLAESKLRELQREMSRAEEEAAEADRKKAMAEKAESATEKVVAALDAQLVAAEREHASASESYQLERRELNTFEDDLGKAWGRLSHLRRIGADQNGSLHRNDNRSSAAAFWSSMWRTFALAATLANMA